MHHRASDQVTPGIRKLILTAHVTSSVGWLGAVVSFLVLSIAGLTSRDAETIRGAYLSMNLIGGYAIVPLSLVALLTGVVQSVGTHWGLFRHYWVLVKLALTFGATLLLLLHQFTAVEGAAGRVSTSAVGTFPELGRLGTQLVGDAGLAVLVLIVITILGEYKPWGLTSYGRRKRREGCRGGSAVAAKKPPASLRVLFVVIALIVVVFVIVHLAGGGLSHRHAQSAVVAT